MQREIIKRKLRVMEKRIIAIISHSAHELIIDVVDVEELENKYDGDEQAYIDDNYLIDGDYTWDWITDITKYTNSKGDTDITEQILKV